MQKKQRIYDAVYGYIELEDVEFELVTLPIFQRLHWIKQLGPLHTVFPSAQHSRFSHSIGVFHIVNKMIEHLKNRPDIHNYKFDEQEKQEKLLKFAALLHDIGHVPLSHIGETVLEDTVKEKLRDEPVNIIQEGTFDPFSQEAQEELNWKNLFREKEYHGSNTKLHERLSAEIVLHSEEVDVVLSKISGWEDGKNRKKAKEKIAQIIVGQNYTDVPTLLLHSELDADRLDYLLRDSFFTGVGYGKIDLDYIISRLAIFRDKAGFADICVENKGLHTVEHYILGRFFLQTQVIFNRKVRFMDLLYQDVMKYMVSHQDKNWNLMGLEDICKCIRNNTVKDIHNIYSYTDAQVFSKMRILHEDLDRKEKQCNATNEECYINDCVKTIMDGRIPEPVFDTCQMLVDLQQEKNCKEKLQKEADQIAKTIADKLDILHERIKANLVEQKVMKYKENEEDGNREAVRIMYKKPDGEDEIKAAAKSKATILGDLIDKALLIFNVYYVKPKKENETKTESNRKTIEEAFKNFVAKEFPS
jgi:HD superfamily phosphohydrolase